MAVEKGVSRAPCYVFELSTDLILSVFDFLDVASHFDFACTCKRLYQASSRIRKRHENAYRKYSVISDLHPATVPTLLRSAFGHSDPIPAWHVRSFEIWRDRKNWSEWKPLSFDTPIGQDTETEAISWTYNYRELDDYLQTVESWDDENVIPHQAQVQTEQGYDGFLKALLIAKCPRLKVVKFVASCKFDEHEATSCFSWLKGFITASVEEYQPWLPGIETLQRVAVCPLSDTWMDQDCRIRNQWWPLLQLPHIDYLYVNNPHVFPGREEYLRPDPYTSSLKHLFFDNLHFGRQSPIKNALIGVPETLISAAFRMAVWSRWEPSLELIQHVTMHHGTTLQSLMLYGPHWIDEHAMPSWICGPENLEDFQNLRHVCISIDEIWESALQRQGDTALTPPTDAYSEAREIHAPYYEEDLPVAFPKSMETLTLWGNREDDFDGPRALIGLGKGLAKLIECGSLRKSESSLPRRNRAKLQGSTQQRSLGLSHCRRSRQEPEC